MSQRPERSFTMEELAKEIQRLKKELDRKKQEIRDLKKLVNKEIDREFPSPAEEFSEKELETYIREILSALRINIESKPDIRPITSHRKTLGKPIVFVKRAFLETTFQCIDSFLDKQIKFNRHIAALCQAFLLRVRHNIERMKNVEDSVSHCEEDLAILKHQLGDLRSSLDELKRRPTDQPPK